MKKSQIIYFNFFMGVKTVFKYRDKTYILNRDFDNIDDIYENKYYLEDAETGERKYFENSASAFKEEFADGMSLGELIDSDSIEIEKLASSPKAGFLNTLLFNFGVEFSYKGVTYFRYAIMTEDGEEKLVVRCDGSEDGSVPAESRDEAQHFDSERELLNNCFLGDTPLKEALDDIKISDVFS